MTKREPRSFDNPVGDQMQKVRIDQVGTLRAPVTADGKDGIVIGDPQLVTPVGADRRPHPLLRLKRRLARL